MYHSRVSAYAGEKMPDKAKACAARDEPRDKGGRGCGGARDVNLFRSKQAT